MPLDLSNYPSVTCDYEQSTADYLQEMRTTFPHVMFDSAAFEALISDQGDEIIDTTFAQVAGFFAPHGFDFWDLTPKGDQYTLTIVPVEQRAEMPARWVADDGYEYKPKRHVSKRPRATNGTGKSKRLECFDAESELPKLVGITPEECHNGWHSHFHQLGEKWVEVGDDWVQVPDEAATLFNLNEWPPSTTNMYDENPSIGRNSLFLLHADADSRIWYSSPPDDRYDDERVVLRSGADNRLHMVCPLPRMFPRFYDAGHIFATRDESEGERSTTSMYLVSPKGTRLLWKGGYGDWMAVIKVDGGRYVIVRPEHNQYVILPSLDGEISEVREFPETEGLKMCFHWLGNGRLLYLHEEKRPNPEVPAMPDVVMVAHQFDFETGEDKTSVLDGFGSTFKMTMRLPPDGSEKTFYAFMPSGALSVGKGHGDWWVWTYRIRARGTGTIAWIWNETTDEVLKITTKDTPRIKPYVFYVAALDRYFGSDRTYGGERLLRFRPFHELTADRPCERLVWNASESGA